MAKMYILIALLPQLLLTLVQGQQYPCSQYLTYITKPGTDETIGQIEIQSPPKVGELHLKVGLKLAAELPTKYYGRLKLARSTEDSAQAVLQGRSLLYHVYFPLPQPLPTLTALWFNSQKYCTDPDQATRHTVTTTITLEHTLFLPNMQNSQPSTSKKSTDTPSSRENNNNIFLPITSKPVSQYNDDNIYLRPTSIQTAPQNSNNHNIFLRPLKIKIPLYNIQNSSNVFLQPNQSPKPQPNQSPAKPVLQHDNDNENNNNNINDNNECGINSRSRVNLLIAKGDQTLPGEWPWLVALFITKKQYEFQCAGSILTRKHILTAAHCLLEPDASRIPSNVLLVALGRFNLTQWRERGTVNREVASYTIHPDYTHKDTGDSDLAILILRSSVEYNDFIKPICLWSGSSDLYNILNRNGYVVGWGRDEFGNRYIEQPRMVTMPIVSTETCHWSFENFVKLTSNRTFCAGKRDGSGPCNGDSGSALVLLDNITRRFQVRGVVSRTVRSYSPEPIDTCDFTKFTVFADVAKYLPWIQQQIST